MLTVFPRIALCVSLVAAQACGAADPRYPRNPRGPAQGTPLAIPGLGNDGEDTPELPSEEISKPLRGITPTITDCGAPETASTGCSVSGSGSALVLKGTVLTATRAYQHGTVRLEGDRITCAGCDCDASGATVVSCNDAVISPGLINPHDHVGWMSSAPYVPDDPDLRYEHRHDWRKGDTQDNEPKITVYGNASVDEKRWGELRFVLGGATSINGSGYATGLARNLDRSEGLEGLGTDTVDYETFPLGDSNGTLRSSDCAYPKLPSPGSIASQQAYTPHVAEGINSAAENEFLCLTGQRPDGVAALGANTAIIHGIGLDAAEVSIAATLQLKLIWSPRSNISLYGETAPVTLYRALGVPIALGTDWLPSGSMNVQRELACARYLNEVYYDSTFSHYELWRMVTVDAAEALGVGDHLGDLAPDLAADVAIFQQNGLAPYQAVTQSSATDVLLVLRGGEVLAGRGELVSALTSGCDPLDVCGTAQQVCLQADIGKDLASLQSSVGSQYALVACGAPPDEPTCEPQRGPQESIAGSSIYTGPSDNDGDGDGIADGNDNCPTIFNPIRLMDGGVQADFDGDGLGDVCDACPMAQGEGC